MCLSEFRSVLCARARGLDRDLNRPLSHKLLTINNYVNCPSNFAFSRSICLFHPPIFEKILMQNIYATTILSSKKGVWLIITSLWYMCVGPLQARGFQGPATEQTQRDVPGSTEGSAGQPAPYRRGSSALSHH